MYMFSKCYVGFCTPRRTTMDLKKKKKTTTTTFLFKINLIARSQPPPVSGGLANVPISL